MNCRFGDFRLEGWHRPWRLLRIGLLVGLCWLGCGIHPVMAESTVRVQVEQVATGQVIPLDDFWPSLTKADIVYLGEVHDSPVDHAAELSILNAVSQRQQRLGVALEMFQRPFQSALDDYLNTAIDGAELRQRSEFDRRWGFPWEYYAPILELAREKGLPLLALNAPQEVTTQVSLGGLDSLTEAEKRWIPPLDQLDMGNQAYQQLLRQVYEDIHPDSAADFFTAFKTVQYIWDATMADSIVRYRQTHPNRPLLVLVGQGHIIYNFGIPSRVSRALKGINQRTVLLSDGHWPDVRGAGAIADFKLRPVEPIN